MATIGIEYNQYTAADIRSMERFFADKVLGQEVPSCVVDRDYTRPPVVSPMGVTSRAWWVGDNEESTMLPDEYVAELATSFSLRRQLARMQASLA